MSNMLGILRARHVLIMVVGGIIFGLLGLFALNAQLDKRVVPHQSPVQTPSPSTSSQPIEHIVIIVEENKSNSRIIGSGAAPYINSLASQYALATNYHAVTHPSLPNYIALTSGTTAGIANDCNPPGSSCTANVPNIVDEIEKSGRGWMTYAEDMPAPCHPNNAGKYAVKHNPFMYYPSVTSDAIRCKQHVVPLSSIDNDLPNSLPNYSFIVPNLCNDMHDCPVKTGDDWLATFVPKILQSRAFTEHRSLLVITWDENEGGGENGVPTVFAGPAAKNNYQSDTNYTHYSLLRTIEDAWGLAPLTQNDKNAAPMNDMLQ